MGQNMELRAMIAALGGPSKVAARLCVRADTVSMWSVRNRLPARHAVPLWLLADAAGLNWRPPGTEQLSLAPRPAQKVAETLTPAQDETSKRDILPAIDTAA
jgi:hypothetical protein